MYKNLRYMMKYWLFFYIFYWLFNFKIYKCILILKRGIIEYSNCVFIIQKDIWIFIAILIGLIFFFFFHESWVIGEISSQRSIYARVNKDYGNFLFKCDITLGEDTSGCTNGSLVVLIRVRVSLGAIFHYNLHLWILLFRGILIVESRVYNMFVLIFFSMNRIDLGA